MSRFQLSDLSLADLLRPTQRQPPSRGSSDSASSNPSAHSDISSVESDSIADSDNEEEFGHESMSKATADFLSLLPIMNPTVRVERVSFVKSS